MYVLVLDFSSMICRGSNCWTLHGIQLVTRLERTFQDTTMPCVHVADFGIFGHLQINCNILGPTLVVMDCTVF